MSPPLPVFVLDAGALIGLERAHPRMTSLLKRVVSGQARVVVPDAVLAQVWRSGSGRQARLAAMIGLKPEQCRTVPLDTATARRIGALVATSGHSDVVDVHVVLVAQDHRGSLITADRGDLVAVDPTIAPQIIDI